VVVEAAVVEAAGSHESSTSINRSWCACASVQQGSIEVGKRADMIVLDRNLFEIPASEISDATVTATIFAGRTVHKKEEAK
jgi:predicted amidohydrolase YtcJ